MARAFAKSGRTEKKAARELLEFDHRRVAYGCGRLKRRAGWSWSVWNESGRRNNADVGKRRAPCGIEREPEDLGIGQDNIEEGISRGRPGAEQLRLISISQKYTISRINGLYTLYSINV